MTIELIVDFVIYLLPILLISGSATIDNMAVICDHNSSKAQ